MQVITKQIDGHKCEPYEEAVIEVPEEHVGPVVDMLGQRKGQMLDLVAGETGGLTRSCPLLHLCCFIWMIRILLLHTKIFFDIHRNNDRVCIICTI